MLNLLAITLLVTAPGPEVRATTIGDVELTGAVQEWSADQLVLQTPEGDSATTLAVDQLLRLDFVAAPNDRDAQDKVTAWLVDGSFASGDEFISSGDRATIAGARRGDVLAAPLEVPVAAVRSVRLARLSPQDEELQEKLDAEWRDILSLEPAGDLIVIRKPGADRLNYVEGTLGDIGPEHVQFTLDGEPIEVSRAKVFGVVFYRDPPPADQTPPAAVVEGRGIRLAADRITWDSTTIVVESSLLGEVRLPPSQLKSIDYSAAQVLYLSDLEPVRAEWTPAPGGASLAPLFGTVARDRSFYSSRLELEYPAASLDPDLATSAGIPRRVAFRKGLAIRSRMELTYRVPPGYPRLRATVGIAPRSRSVGEVELQVLGDGEELWRQTIDGRETPVELQCDVDGVRELTINVGFGSADGIDIGSGDILHLCNARITK